MIDRDYAIGYGGALSGQPIKRRYCRYPATKGQWQPFLPLYMWWDVHWHHLANMNEPSVCSAMRRYVKLIAYSGLSQCFAALGWVTGRAAGLLKAVPEGRKFRTLQLKNGHGL